MMYIVLNQFIINLITCNQGLSIDIQPVVGYNKGEQNFWCLERGGASMQFKKVSCLQCDHYKECSQTTRMFINYCGSSRENFKNQIRDAQTECHSRRRFLSQTAVLHLVPVMVAKSALSVS